jgi:hypothetical protein
MGLDYVEAKRLCAHLRPVYAAGPNRENHGFLISVLVAFGPLLHAQDVYIRVLNGRNGKPITNECLNVSLGAWHGADLLAPTDSEGVVVLHLRDNEMTSDAVSARACNGMATVGSKPFPKGTDVIIIMSDEYVACQEYGKIVPGDDPANPNLLARLMPAYSIKRILELGVTASNRCGKFRAEAKPGELIFCVRPPTWLEKMRR